jgi:aquaporin Z
MAEPTRSIHWPEYLIEGAALGLFMMSAAVFGTVLNHPASPAVRAIPNELARRALMGLAMGSTAVSIVYSRWGQRSGAHINPAITLTFYRLGKVARRDAIGYITAQFTGAVLGITLASLLIGGALSNSSVNYVATVPGAYGHAVAFGAEAAISFVLMLTVLAVSNTPAIARFTGICAGLLVWSYITIEAPLSGMSMNPARTLGSALLAQRFMGLWIYFTAPVLGMFAAAELFTRRYGLRRVACAKLHHPRGGVCIFGCSTKPSAQTSIQAA